MNLLEFEAMTLSGLNQMVESNKNRRISGNLPFLNVLDMEKNLPFSHALVKPFTASLEFSEEVISNEIIREINFTSDFVAIASSFNDYFTCMSQFFCFILI